MSIYRLQHILLLNFPYEMTNCIKLRKAHMDKAKKSRERTIALSNDHDNHALQFFVNEIRSQITNSSSQDNEADPNIMAHILNNGNVRDKEGKELTVLQYLEKITPQKNVRLHLNDRPRLCLKFHS